MTHNDFARLTENLVPVTAINDNKEIPTLINPEYIVALTLLQHPAYGQVIALRTINSEFLLKIPADQESQRTT